MRTKRETPPGVTPDTTPDTTPNTAEKNAQKKKRGPVRHRVLNVMHLRLPALSVNEGMARAAVAAFCAQLNPTAVELADVKCAVSEAVTNCIVHAYRAPDPTEEEGKILAEDEEDGFLDGEPDISSDTSEKTGAEYADGDLRRPGTVFLTVKLCEGGLAVIGIRDKGCGIPDVKQAMQPLFTTDPEGERSGMGFTVMESFCDRVRVSSHPGRGTTVTLWKRFSSIDPLG